MDPELLLGSVIKVPDPDPAKGGTADKKLSNFGP